MDWVTDHKMKWKLVGEYLLETGLALAVYLLLRKPVTVELDSMEPVIRIPKPTTLSQTKFNRDIRAKQVSIPVAADSFLTGCRTNNRTFYTLVMQPVLRSQLTDLAKRSPTEIINILTIFNYTVYQKYFGRDFYRWGGDLFDLDDPQTEGVRWQYSYGLDCSGFVTAPYEIAVDCGLLKPTAEGAIFSSKGYKLHCNRHKFEDRGGRLGGGNQYRLDTAELAQLGRIVFTLPRNGKPTRSQTRMLQPGDLVGDTGHFGIIIEINQIPYYLESGGRVVPEHDYRPVRADKALTSLATKRSITVRRSLPDRTGDRHLNGGKK